MSNIRRVRPVQRNSGNRRSINGDDNEKPHLSENGKTYNKEEILALFRRIQSSISAAEFAASKGRTNNASAESVLEVLHQSRKQVKGKTSYGEESTGLSERENNKQEKVERIDSVSNEGNLSRPPSNFMKKSPIPSVHVERVKDDVMSATDGEELEAMKLAELKELAKSRGVKGYSKLKKAELIELLKTL
ncbi:SAP-like protein BP-73 [Tanacetum coccineum]